MNRIFNLVDVFERHNVIGSILRVSDPRSVAVRGDDAILRVAVLTHPNHVSRSYLPSKAAEQFVHFDDSCWSGHVRDPYIQ